uniref:tRNA pseudouridine synthase n=1 Tax=Odontella aurita TaxID=265563 RepID=A0A7S4MSL3_9STRA|mmetsp:Transcript_30139/g.89687  ORF Transcript_30139/g.89687 Transcript_30139/m.89687 type:complete len:376 (+) Transcript_30139:104-1231(+)
MKRVIWKPRSEGVRANTRREMGLEEVCPGERPNRLLLVVIFCVSLLDRWCATVSAFVPKPFDVNVLRLKASRSHDADDHEVRKVCFEGIRYRARVAYDGTGFNGWQTQAKGRTIQGDIEAVLSRRFDRPVRIVGAGRTDAGVHARGQAFHFDLRADEIGVADSKCFDLQLQRSLNSMLRRDIRVWNTCQAPPPSSYKNWEGIERNHKWHVIYNAEKKLYSYRISTAPYLDPLLRHTRTHVFDPTNIELLRTALQHFEGTHDFRAFAGAIDANERKSGKVLGTIRTVYAVNLVEEGNGNYRVDFLLKGALYKMVRNMMGTALAVAQGRLEEDRLLEFLHHDSSEGKVLQFVRKDNKCKPAAPEGLTLEHVYFDGSF